MENLPFILGIAASAIGLAGFIPYITSILSGRTVPHRTSWFVWAALGVVTAASYFAAGARESALLPAVNAVAHIAVAGLSLKYGTGGWSRMDKIFLAGAVLGMALWLLTSNPVTALAVTIVVEAIGAIPTILKTYNKPASEDKNAWGLFLTANTLNLAAVSPWTIVLLAYPIYSFTASLAMASLTRLRRSG
jgi:hypothetical protein